MMLLCFDVLNVRAGYLGSSPMYSTVRNAVSG